MPQFRRRKISPPFFTAKLSPGKIPLPPVDCIQLSHPHISPSEIYATLKYGWNLLPLAFVNSGRCYLLCSLRVNGLVPFLSLFSLPRTVSTFFGCSGRLGGDAGCQNSTFPFLDGRWEEPVAGGGDPSRGRNAKKFISTDPFEGHHKRM